MTSFPTFSKQHLLDSLPCLEHGRLWSTEHAYRQECIVLMGMACKNLNLPTALYEKAALMLLRCFTTTSSTKFVGMRKWALVTAAVFVVCKADVRHTQLLVRVVDASLLALRAMQKRSLEPQYFNADGSPGNPAFLGQLCQLVREVELPLLLGAGFDVEISSPSSVVVHQLNELGLTATAELQYPDLKDKISAVREEAVRSAHHSVVAHGSLVCLMHAVPEVTLAAIFRACQDNKLQWYLRPAAEQQQQQQGEPPQQGGPSPSPSPPPPQLQQQQRPAGAKSWVPALSSEQLAGIAADLPVVLPSAHRAAAAAADTNDGMGCFRSRGGCWLALTRPGRGIMLSSCDKQAQQQLHVASDARVGGSSSWQLQQQQQPESFNNISGSHCEAATAGPCLGDPSPSPDSINQPGSSAAGRAVVARHVTFGKLPPSVVALQKEFRRMRGEQEALERAQQAHADMLAEEAELQQQLDAEDQQQQQLEEHEALRQCVQQAVSAAAAGSGGSGGSDASAGSGSKGKRPRERDSADGQTDCSDVDESDSAVSKFRRIAQPPPPPAAAAGAAAGQAGGAALLA